MAQIYKPKGGVAAGLYDHLGANIQPGVLGMGGRVVMTGMKRKPGFGKRERGDQRDRGNKKQDGCKKSEKINLD